MGPEFGWISIGNTSAYWGYSDPGGGGGGEGGGEPPTCLPVINGIVPSSGPGQGYLELYGSGFSTAYTATMPGSSYVYLIPVSDTQVNASFGGLSNGAHTISVTNNCGFSNAAVYTVQADPTPVIHSVTPSTWQAGQQYQVTISGSGFGTSPDVSIGGQGIFASVQAANDIQINLWVTVDANAPPQSNIPVTVTSNGYWGMGFQGGGGGQPQSSPWNVVVQRLLAPRYHISYRAYLPFDHFSGPSPCFQVVAPGVEIPYALIYKGDSNGSYRMMEGVDIVPAWGTYSNFTRDTGQTRNYGQGSPANGYALSMLDEDNVSNDCHLWHQSDTASVQNLLFASSFGSTQGSVRFYGGVANLFEPGPEISMDMAVTVGAQSSTVAVSFNHNCFPAHEVVVNGQVVYSFIPSDNSIVHIGLCLAGVLPNVSGQTGTVQVPYQTAP